MLSPEQDSCRDGNSAADFAPAMPLDFPAVCAGHTYWHGFLASHSAQDSRSTACGTAKSYSCPWLLIQTSSRIWA